MHQLDLHHPVIYTSAYITDAAYINKYVPSLDILGINVYGAVKQTHLVFTEFGPPGPWALSKGINGCPLELTDRQRADFYAHEVKALVEQKGYNLG